MSLIISLFGILTAASLTVTFWLSTRVFTLGAMSLPAMLMVFSLIYFYLMPAFAFADGSAEHLGT